MTDHSLKSRLERALAKQVGAVEFNYLIQQLLSCVERAEGFEDGGPITREAEAHHRAWLKRIEIIDSRTALIDQRLIAVAVAAEDVVEWCARERPNISTMEIDSLGFALDALREALKGET